MRNLLCIFGLHRLLWSDEFFELYDVSPRPTNVPSGKVWVPCKVGRCKRCEAEVVSRRYFPFRPYTKGDESDGRPLEPTWST